MSTVWQHFLRLPLTPLNLSILCQYISPRQDYCCQVGKSSAQLSFRSLIERQSFFYVFLQMGIVRDAFLSTWPRRR